MDLYYKDCLYLYLEFTEKCLKICLSAVIFMVILKCATLGNALNMKHVHFCTGFIFCAYLATVTTQEF